MDENRPAIAGAICLDARAADSVMRAVDMVEERLGEDIGAQDMACVACFSPFYFSRLFARATGHAPYDYLMRRRVAVAAEEVVGGTRSLTDIALDYGFEVPDTFARAFRRCFGVLPSEARRAGSYHLAVARTKIERRYVEAMLETPPHIPEGRMEGDLILEGAWLEGGDGEIVAALAAEGRRALVLRGGSLRATRAFAATAESGGSSRIPEFPLASTRIPGGRRARFPVGGGAERLGFVLEYAYRTWLPLSGELERFPPYDILDIGEDGEIALLLVLGNVSGGV
jgi:AraC-like DNA-binding protein